MSDNIELLEKSVLKQALKDISQILYSDPYRAQIVTSSVGLQLKNVPLSDVQNSVLNYWNKLSDEDKTQVKDGIEKRFHSSQSLGYPESCTDNDIAYENALNLLV